MSSNPAFAINEDGSAKDAGAYRAALLADPEKVKAIQARPEARPRRAAACASPPGAQLVPLWRCHVGGAGAEAACGAHQPVVSLHRPSRSWPRRCWART
jgi:hypothetical protein